MRKVYSSANYIEANTVKSMLENQGIAVFLKGESLTGALGELPLNVAEIDVMVDEEQWNDAKRTVEQFSSSLHESRPDWLCRHCGESNASSFEICWHCSTEH